MTRLLFLALAALCATLWGAGCSDRGTPMIAEMDEPFYIQGVQLNKQGRNGEALASFMKVIDKRGERGAPESHLEVGVICLNHTKEPVLAYYHFKRYLELQANSKEAPRVRTMLDAALRDIARRFPGRPTEDQSVRLAAAEEISKLRRENDELRAEVQTLRGGGAALANRAPRMVPIGDAGNPSGGTSPPSVAIANNAIVPAPTGTLSRAAAGAGQPPAPQSSKMSAPRGATTNPPRTVTPTPPRQTPPGGRTHTLRPKETLYAVSRQYGVKMEDLAKANGISNPGNVPAGTVLRIP